MCVCMYIDSAEELTFQGDNKKRVYLQSCNV